MSPAREQPTGYWCSRSSATPTDPVGSAGGRK
jgi:hypothetical protein